MKITVTQEHIDKGLFGSSMNCPIALSVGEHERAKNCIVSVDSTIVIEEYIIDDDVVTNGRHIYLQYSMPEKAREFIRRFDRYLEVKPFSFEAKLMYYNDGNYHK